MANSQSDTIANGFLFPNLNTETQVSTSKRKQITPQKTKEIKATKNGVPEQIAPYTAIEAPLKVFNTSPALSESSEDTAPLTLSNDAASIAPEGSIQSSIQYAAKDAIVLDVKHKTIHLYGAGIIEHDTIKLEAEEVCLDWKNHIIAAMGKKNTARAIEEKAVLTKDDVEYIAESIRYNFESQRAIAHRLFTKQGDGILQANKIKKDRETTFYADRATYTTCNLTQPHFHVTARQLKITQDDKVVSGPFNLHFDGVPTPLGFLVGMFYFPQGSGVIPPKYGGESAKGFCLQNGGYYINFKDYADLALQGSIYSKGSREFTAASNYKKRYRYDGNLRFTRSIMLEPAEEKLPKKEKSWDFKWNHNTKNGRNSSWSAKVHLESKPLSKKKTSTESSIRYMNKLEGLPYTLNTSLQHTHKAIAKPSSSATIPEIVLSTGSKYPFRKKGGIKRSWYSNIYIQHKVEFQNKLSNSANGKLDFLKLKDWRELWRSKKYGIRHTVPLQTNIKILKYLNLTPQITYLERWYWEQINYTDNATDKPDEATVRGFVRVYEYNFGASLKTTFNGTHTFGENTTVKAIRHEIEPVVAFTYTPDFSDPRYGYWQTIGGGEKDVKKFDRFKDAIYRSPGEKASAVLKVDLKNKLVMKVKSHVDAKTPTTKVAILERFDWSTSYDFYKDKHAMSDIEFKTHTHYFDQLLYIEFASTFDPYYFYKNSATSDTHTAKNHTRSNTFAWQHGKGLGHMKKASLRINVKLGPGKKNSTLDKDDELQDGQDTGAAPAHSQEASIQYVDFTIPWNMDLEYKWERNCPEPGDDPKKVSSLGFEWHMNLTENWKVTCKSAYDLTKRELMGNATDIGIHRDLHCWEMDFNWNPLGERQTYKFSIGLKAPVLKDLKYSRDKEYQKY